MVYIMYILLPIAFVPRAARVNLCEGQELVLFLSFPAEDGVQGSPGEGNEQPSFIEGRAGMGSTGFRRRCGLRLSSPLFWA